MTTPWPAGPDTWTHPVTGPEPSGTRPRTDWRGRVVAAVAVALAVAASGFPLGALWSVITPKVEVVMTDTGPTTVESEPEGYVAGDGSFALLAIGSGVALAVVLWLLVRRQRGPAMLLALAVGSVAGGVIAAWVGHRIGLTEYLRLLEHAPVGRHFRRPVDVRSKEVGLWFGFLPWARGTVLLQAATAVALYTLLAGFNRAPDLDDDAIRGAAVDSPAGSGGRFAGEGGPELVHDDPVSSGSMSPPDPRAEPGPPGPGTAAPPPE